MSTNTNIRSDDKRQQINTNQGSQANGPIENEPEGKASLAILNQMLKSTGEGEDPIASFLEEVISEHGTEDNTATASNTASMNQLEAFIEKMEEERSDENDAVFDKAVEQGSEEEGTLVTTTDAIESSNRNTQVTNDSETSSSSGGMQSVFALQGWICQLDEDATKSNAEQSQDQVAMNDAFQESANEQYDKIKQKIKKLEKEGKNNSLWGFVKGLGSLMKDISKLKGDLVKGVVTGNFKAVGSDVKSIKNNVAVGDIENMGKLVYQVSKLTVAAETGNTKGVKSAWSNIEENPSLGLTIQLLGYAAAAAAIIATGGSDTAIVMAALMVMSQIQVTDSSGDKVNLFDAAADEIGKATGSQLTGDIILMTLALGTGDIALDAMVLGTMLTSMAPKIADDSGLSGKDKEILTISLEVVGAALAIGGGCGALSSSAETAADATIEDEWIEMTTLENSSTSETASEDVSEAASEQASKETSQTLSEKISSKIPDGVQKAAGYVQKTATLLNGMLGIMSGGKIIDMGYQQKAVMELQGKLNQSWANIQFGDQLLSNLSKQLDNLNSQYSGMIDNFGAIAAPGIASSEALV